LELSFNVTGQTISRADELAVVADSRGIISLAFEFSEEWDAIAVKTAVITTDSHTYYESIDAEGKVSADDIPILKQGLCYFSVFGGYVEDTAELQTANELFINVLPSGLKEENPAPPTPGKYDEIKAIAENAEDIAEGVRTDADNGVFDGANGRGVVDISVDETYHLLVTYSDNPEPVIVAVVDPLTTTAIADMIGDIESALNAILGV
jgi:hypothetical protein